MSGSKSAKSEMLGYLVFDRTGRLIRFSGSFRSKLLLSDSVLAEKPSIAALFEGLSTRKCLDHLEGAGFPVRFKDASPGEAALRAVIGTIDKGLGIYVMELFRERPAAGSSLGVGVDFLTTVSHELRVPLNGVIGFSHLLGHTNLDREQADILAKLQSCNYLLKGLINDVLEYSRIAEERIELRFESVRLGDFVDELLGLFQEPARAKGLELKVVTEESRDLWCLLPRLRISQILSNLLSNAIKFTEKGWVRLSAKLTELDGQATLEFRVADTGPGLSEEEAHLIFEPFRQLPSGKTEGSGLGLAICKGMAELLKGSLTVKTDCASGTCFCFSCPVTLSAAGADSEGPLEPSSVVEEASKALPDPLARRPDSPSCAGKPEAGQRVLIVEDNVLNAEILGHFLRDCGLAVEVADTGLKAVEMFENGKYDIIFMDIMLPDLNGYEATIRILEAMDADRRVPIVGVTAKVFRQDRARCFEVGMTEVLHKPIDFKLLREVLERYVVLPSGAGKLFSKKGREKPIAVEEASSRYNSFDEAVLGNYLSRMSTPANDSRKVLEQAIRVLAEEIAKLKAAEAAGNAEDISFRAHALKGAVTLLGGRDLADLSKGLELLASRGGVDLRAGHWIKLIEAAFAEFCREVESYLKAREKLVASGGLT